MAKPCCEGPIWNAGDGTNIFFWSDNWLPCDPLDL